MTGSDAPRSTVIVLRSGETIAVARPPEAVIASRMAAAEEASGWWCPVDGRLVLLSDVVRCVPSHWLDAEDDS